MILVASLLGCESAPVFESDPNEITVNGIVEGKRAKKDLEEKEKALNAANNEKLARGISAVLNSGASTFAEGAMAGALFELLDQKFGDGPSFPGETFIYVVKAENGLYYKVESKFPGFEVGECVKLFVSENVERYPLRMTDGIGCKENT